MKPQDLRIGNLLIDSLTHSLLKVSDISETGFTTIVIDRSKFPLPDGWSAMPVLLTEEWLLKCGYFKREGVDYVLNVMALKMISRFQSNICYSELGGIYLGDHVKYVHQLQNLYKWVTGNELIIAT